jgi:uncharacterized protein
MTRQLVSAFPKAFGAFVFALAAGLAFAATGDFADIPALKQRVTDTTATLSSADEARIESILHAFEEKKGSQIVVLIVPTTQPEAIEQYAIRVAEAWKVGRKGVDDGAILLVAKNDRKLRIEVGRGLEGVLPDAIAKRVIAEIISPRFRAGDYSGGILAGVEKMIAVVDGEALPPPQNKRVSTSRSADFFSDFLPFAFIAAFVVGGILRALLGRFVGASLTAGVMGLAAFLLFGAISTAVVSGIIVFIVLLFGSGRGWSSGQGWSSGGWSSGSGGGGGFSGGGGDFGGGGASGNW